jgi:hypothetical protein
VTRRLLFSVVVVTLGACAPTEQERAEQTCSAICGCMAPPLPALQDQCMAECRMDFDSSRLSDQCIDCISANSDRCATLVQTCEPICDPSEPDPFFDAGVPF